jgi:hypothetical protein
MIPERDLAAFQAGYELGREHGHEDGWRDALAMLHEAGQPIRDLKPSRHPTHAELTRRRTTYSTPARGPVDAAEIERCMRSWDVRN